MGSPHTRKDRYTANFWTPKNLLFKTLIKYNNMYYYCSVAYCYAKLPRVNRLSVEGDLGFNTELVPSSQCANNLPKIDICS